MKAIIIAAIRVYKNCISPFMPGSCRFQPTCSSYCIEAIENYGLAKGLWLFARRISKCHPFHPGGFDPVKPLENNL